MALYFYQALSRDGKKVSGALDATSEKQVKEQLSRGGLYVISVVPMAEQQAKFSFASLFERTVSVKDKLMFTQQFAVLLKAGVPLVDALNLLIDQMGGSFKKVIVTLRDGVREGKSLAGAEALSHEVVHFLETALDKLIWNPRENLETWDSCKLIASRLEQLHACGIIPSERELNLLIWTLFCRFGYFIQSMGNQIPDKVYAAIKQDLCEPGCSCLEIGELADDVITKKEYLSIVVQQMELVHKLVHKLYSDPIETASPKASGIPKSGETVSLLKSQAHE